MNRFAIFGLAILAFGAGKTLAQDFVVSISFDGGGWFDRSFNEGTWAGITEAVRDLSAVTDFDILIYNGAPETTTTGVRNLAEAGTNPLVHFVRHGKAEGRLPSANAS